MNFSVLVLGSFHYTFTAAIIYSFVIIHYILLTLFSFVYMFPVRVGLIVVHLSPEVKAAAVEVFRYYTIKIGLKNE